MYTVTFTHDYYVHLNFIYTLLASDEDRAVKLAAGNLEKDLEALGLDHKIINYRFIVKAVK